MRKICVRRMFISSSRQSWNLQRILSLKFVNLRIHDMPRTSVSRPTDFSLSSARGIRDNLLHLWIHLQIKKML